MKYCINCTSGALRQASAEDAKRGSIVGECSLDHPHFALPAFSLSLSLSLYAGILVPVHTL